MNIVENTHPELFTLLNGAISPVSHMTGKKYAILRQITEKFVEIERDLNDSCIFVEKSVSFNPTAKYPSGAESLTWTRDTDYNINPGRSGKYCFQYKNLNEGKYYNNGNVLHTDAATRIQCAIVLPALLSHLRVDLDKVMDPFIAALAKKQNDRKNPKLEERHCAGSCKGPHLL